MSTISTIAMDVNSLMGTGSPLLRNHQLDLAGSNSAKVMDRINYYHPSSGGDEYYGGYSHQKGGKRSIALTALTLLAFLFFLHILQNCIQEQTDMMNPQVVIMQARLRAAQREAAAEANKRVGEAAEALVDEQIKVSDINDFKSVENVDSAIDTEKYQYTKLTHHTPLRTIQRTN